MVERLLPLLQWLRSSIRQKYFDRKALLRPSLSAGCASFILKRRGVGAYTGVCLGTWGWYPLLDACQVCLLTPLYCCCCCRALRVRCVAWCSSQLQLEAVQIRVKAASSAVSESKQYLSKLPESLKDVEKALVPLRK